MTGDRKLEQLAAARSQALGQLQSARSTQEDARSAYDRARKALDRAEKAQAEAYEQEKTALEYEQRTPLNKRQRIERSKGIRRQEHRSARRTARQQTGATQTTSNAYGAALIASAQADRIAAERSQAVVTAKQHCIDARRHVRHAKLAYDSADKAYQDRLAIVRDKAVAVQAHVPDEYLEDVLIRRNWDRTTNIYFGGKNSPDGEGHGHYVMDYSGTVTYARNPGELHGAQNVKKANSAG